MQKGILSARGRWRRGRRRQETNERGSVNGEGSRDFICLLVFMVNELQASAVTRRLWTVTREISCAPSSFSRVVRRPALGVIWSYVWASYSVTSFLHATSFFRGDSQSPRKSFGYNVRPRASFARVRSDGLPIASTHYDKSSARFPLVFRPGNRTSGSWAMHFCFGDGSV